MESFPCARISKGTRNGREVAHALDSLHKYASRPFDYCVGFSHRVKPRQKLRIALPARGLSGSYCRINLLKRLSFGVEIGARVNICSVQLFVSEKTADNSHVGASRDQ